MKKEYESPEFELHRILLCDNLLAISVGEGSAEKGDIVEPGND